MLWIKLMDSYAAFIEFWFVFAHPRRCETVELKCILESTPSLRDATVSSHKQSQDEHGQYHSSHVGLQKYLDGVAEAVDRRTAVEKIKFDIGSVIAMPSNLIIARQDIRIGILRRH